MENNRLDLKEKMACIELKVDKIINNDLAHLHEKISNIECKMDKVEGKLWWVLGTVVIGQLATLTVVLITFMLKH